MADRELILDVLERKTGNGLRDAANDMDQLADRTDKTSRTLSEFNADVERSRQRVHDLNVEFATSAGDNTGLLADLKKAKRELKDLENIAGAVLPNIGASASNGLLSSLGGLGSNLRGALIPVAAGLGVALAPSLGAAVAGAIVGGVGAGGIAGGIAAAAQDPKVKAAASVFGAEIKREFAMTGTAFVQPVIDSLEILEAGFRDLHLEQAFAKVAPFVDDLARGIAGLGREFMPGFNRALEAAGPALQVLSSELPQIGAALGDMIGDIAESKGALDGLRFILNATEATLRGTGALVSALGDVFHFFGARTAEVTGALEDLFFYVPGLNTTLAGMNDFWEETLGIAPKVTSAFRSISGETTTVSTSGEKAIGVGGLLKQSMDAQALAAKAEADSLAALKRSLDDAFNATMSLDQANLAIKQDTLNLKEAVKEHGASLSTNTQAGLSNRQMLLGLVSDYARQRDAASTSREATAAASAKFRDQVEALIALGGKLGFSKSELEKLLGKYRELIAAPNISKTIKITTNYVTTGTPSGALSSIGNVGKIAGFAEGGYVPGSKGSPQLAIVHGGEYVLSNDMLSGMKMPAASVGGGGGRTYNIHVSVPVTANPAEVGREVVDVIQQYERSSGAGWRS